MAEKRLHTKRNRNFGTVGIVLQPFLIYLVINFVTAVILTYLVNMVVQKAGGTAAALFAEQKATVNAVIGGLAMLAGVLPLLSDFRRETENGNRCDYKEEEKENTCYGMNDNSCNSGKTDDSDIAGPLLYIPITITLAFTSSIAINILFIFLHLTENSEAYNQVAAHQYSVFFPVGLFLYGIVSPFVEEVVFRGIVYNRMKKFFSIAASLVLSALLFALYHGNIVQAVYGFLMGMLIACTYETCGGFLYAFLFHAAANVSVYVVTGSPVLYERFITPYYGMAFAGISVLLLFILRFVRSFRRYQKPKPE